jgi:hypothetical protein
MDGSGLECRDSNPGIGEESEVGFATSKYLYFQSSKGAGIRHSRYKSNVDNLLIFPSVTSDPLTKAQGSIGSFLRM